MLDKESKRDIKTLVKLSKYYSYDNPATLDRILSYGEKNQLFQSVYGQKYIERIAGIAYGNADGDICILCGRNVAENGVVCNHCIEKVSGGNSGADLKDTAENNVNEETVSDDENVIIQDTSFDEEESQELITDEIDKNSITADIEQDVLNELDSIFNDISISDDIASFSQTESEPEDDIVINEHSENNKNIWKIIAFIFMGLFAVMTIICILLLMGII